MVRFPSLICEKPVATNRNIVSSGKYDGWIHIYYHNICKQLLRKLKKIVLYSVVNAAFKKEAPYSNLNDTEFALFASGTYVLPKKNFQIFFNKLNAFTESEDNKCKNYTDDQVNELGLNVSITLKYIIFTVSYWCIYRITKSGPHHKLQNNRYKRK